MKHKGSTSDTQECRNRELFLNFERLRRTGDYANMYDLCIALANTEMSEHYISVERAVAILCEYLKNGRVKTKSIWKKRLYECFLENCKETGADKGNRLAAVQNALAEKACCAGISPCRVNRILRKMGARS